jgi:hypothetical protein
VSENFKKKERGYYEEKYDQENKVLVVKWNDNSVVNIMSNFEDIHPVSTAKRYSQNEKKIVKISCPKLVVSYNSHKGGSTQLRSKEKNGGGHILLTALTWQHPTHGLSTEKHCNVTDDNTNGQREHSQRPWSSATTGYLF